MQEDSQLQNQPISAEQVSHFLRSQPNFFEQHANLLTEIHLPSPHGKGTISLAERQQLAQRDKIRVLDAMLAQLIESAQENEVTSSKVHALSIQLIANQNFADLQQLIAQKMQQDFAVTQSLLHIWSAPHNIALAHDNAFTGIDPAIIDWVSTLAQPFCGEKPAITNALLAAQLKSFVFIPLYRHGDKTHAFGLLILGAENPQRFQANMGTMYLQLIGELISAAVAPYIE
jgi:uncharacterized protein YigA (DUF484 family)